MNRSTRLRKACATEPSSNRHQPRANQQLSRPQLHRSKKATRTRRTTMLRSDKQKYLVGHLTVRVSLMLLRLFSLPHLTASHASQTIGRKLCRGLTLEAQKFRPFPGILCSCSPQTCSQLTPSAPLQLARLSFGCQHDLPSDCTARLVFVCCRNS